MDDCVPDEDCVWDVAESDSCLDQYICDYDPCYNDCGCDDFEPAVYDLTTWPSTTPSPYDVCTIECDKCHYGVEDVCGNDCSDEDYEGCEDKCGECDALYDQLYG